MKMQALNIGLRVRHPQYGVGTVKALSEHLAEIRFDDATRSLDPEASEITRLNQLCRLRALRPPSHSLLAP
jgi:hypothetical protein